METNKKIGLDRLFYDIAKQQYDFKLCGLKKINDAVIATKWKKYSELIFPLNPWDDWKIKYINQRQVLPIELVLDLESADKINSIIKELKSWGVIFYVFSTGSRGFHIHIFFNREISDKERMDIIDYFGSDPQINSSHMIALEYAEHWKSGKIKEEVKYD